MFPYKTNSPDYLDYIAANMTREEILASPKFCGLLENEYIRDNTEVALRWHAAKFGDYQAKWEFVEYYLCNGPELDADTLLHYRALAQADPVVMEIAFSYFNDADLLLELRETKYGKKRGDRWTDCFKNPCFYLGDFSGVMGSMGDSKNVDTYFNLIGDKWKAYWNTDNKKDLKDQHDEELGKPKKDEATQVTTDAAKKVGADLAGKKTLKPTTEEGAEISSDSGRSGNAPASSSVESKVRSPYDWGWRELGRAIFESDVEFAKYMAKNTKWAAECKFGDWFGRTCSHTIDLIDKANTTRMLGDCYRMWSQVRGLRVFGSDNQYKPITSDQLVETKNADGTIRFGFKNSKPTPADATQGINRDLAAAARLQVNQLSGSQLSQMVAGGSWAKDSEGWIYTDGNGKQTTVTNEVYNKIQEEKKKKK